MNEDEKSDIETQKFLGIREEVLKDGEFSENDALRDRIVELNRELNKPRMAVESLWAILQERGFLTN